MLAHLLERERPDHARSDDPLGIDEERVGEAEHLVATGDGHVGVEDGRERDALALEEGGGPGRIFALVDADDDKAPLGFLLVEGLQIGHLPFTGNAPARPKIHQDGPPAQAGQRERAPRGVAQVELGRGRTDPGLGRRAACWRCWGGHTAAGRGGGGGGAGEPIGHDAQQGSQP